MHGSVAGLDLPALRIFAILRVLSVHTYEQRHNDQGDDCPRENGKLASAFRRRCRISVWHGTS